MKIHCDFTGVPILYKTLNKKKEIDLDLTHQGCTLRELVSSLVRRFGVPIKKALLGPTGEIDPEIRVVLNQNNYLAQDRMETILHDGDTLHFRGAS